MYMPENPAPMMTASKLFFTLPLCDSPCTFVMTHLLASVHLASSVQLSCSHARARVSLRERQRGRSLPATSQSELTTPLDPFRFESREAPWQRKAAPLAGIMPLRAPRLP